MYKAPDAQRSGIFYAGFSGLVHGGKSARAGFGGQFRLAGFNNGRARLVTGQYDGQAYIAVQLDLAPGWHSYWQYPGASGISPEFTFTGSGETAFGSVIYQAPYFFDDEAGGFYGYTGRSALPRH